MDVKSMVSKIVKNDVMLKAGMGDKVIYVKTDIQKALLIGELLGQISDGKWENSKPFGHWKEWSRADIKVGDQGTKNMYPQKTNYNFHDAELLSIVGNRMIGMVRLIKKYPKIGKDDSSINAANSLAEYLYGDSTLPTKMLDYMEKYMDLIKSKSGASDEEILKTINDKSLYSSSDLKKDLVEIKKSFTTKL